MVLEAGESFWEVSAVVPSKTHNGAIELLQPDFNVTKYGGPSHLLCPTSVMATW